MPTLFPFKPDYSEPLKESFEWLTEVQQSYDGIEHRRQLREFPRRFLEFKLVLTKQDKQIFENLINVKQSAIFYLPLWYEKSLLTASASISDTTLSLDTTNSSFTDFALLWNGFFDYELVSIASKTTTTLTLNDGLVKTWSVGSVIYPVALARLDPAIKLKRYSSQALQVNLKFWFEQNSTAFTAVDFPTLYRNLPVLEIRNNWAREVTSEYNRDLEILDFEINGRFVDDKSGLSTVFLDYHFLLKTLAERKAFMDNLYGLSGKWSAAWVATGQHDFTLIHIFNNETTILRVAYCGISDYGLAIPKQDIKITLNDGSVYYRRILNVSNNFDGTETIVVYFIDRIINAWDVLIISYLMYMRLSSDTVVIEHYTDTVAACSVTFQSTRNPVIEDVPPPPIIEGW